MRQKRYHQLAGPFTAAELAEKLGLSLQGDGDRRLVDVKPLDEAGHEHLSFLDNPKYKQQAEKAQAGAVLVVEENAHLFPDDMTKIIAPQAYLAFAQALQFFYPQPVGEHGISAQATVHASAIIGQNVSIAAGSYIGEGVEIGDNCYIGPNVTIQCAVIGRNCIIHPGVAIGQDGFGFAASPTGAAKVPQIAGVVIGNDVEIGANTTIDRGALSDTVVGDGTKIDNLVQIGHSAKLGAHCQVVSQVAIAGSTKVGNGVVFGGQSGVAGHIEIADGVMLAARTGVTKSIKQRGVVVGGTPAVPIREWRKQQALLARLAKKKGS